MSKSFANSNYRKHLLQVDKSQVTAMAFHDRIQNSLKASHRQAYKESRDQYPAEDPPTIAVRVWSGNELYPALKKALMADSDEECRALAPFMRALNFRLVCQNPDAMVTFRGSKMTANDLETLHCLWSTVKNGEVPGVNEVVTRIPSYYASSRDISIARGFAKNGYLIKFRIPAGCPNCRDIVPWCKWTYEKEVLFPPYTCFRILSVNPDASDRVVAEFEVLDNQSVPPEDGILGSQLFQVACASACDTNGMWAAASAHIANVFAEGSKFGN